MKLETPFIALLIGALFFTGLYTVFLTAGDAYEVDYDTTLYDTEGKNKSFKESFDSINNTKSEMDRLTAEFGNTTLKKGDASLFPFFSLAFKMGQLVFSSLTTFKDTMMATIEIIGIPAVVVVSLFSILLVVYMCLVVFILLGRST